MINRQTQNRLARLFAFLLIIGGTAFTGLAYTVSVPAYSQVPLAWSFQAKTVANAFPSPDYGTTLYFWDAANTTYVTDTYVGAWGNPNYTINTGVGFYYENPPGGSINVTVSGSTVTASSFTFPTFVVGKTYFIASAYDTQAGNVQCVQNCEGSAYPYTTSHLNLGYSPANGDAFSMWISGGWVTGTYAAPGITEVCSGAPGTQYWRRSSGTYAFGTYQSPYISVPYGFWFTPASNTTWTQYPSSTNCSF